MWSPDGLRKDLRALLRLVPVFVLAGMCAGCFQPLYGEHAAVAGGNPSVATALAAVQVMVNTPADPVLAIALTVATLVFGVATVLLLRPRR